MTSILGNFQYEIFQFLVLLCSTLFILVLSMDRLTYDINVIRLGEVNSFSNLQSAAGCWNCCGWNSSWCGWRYVWKFAKRRRAIRWWCSSLGRWCFQVEFYSSGITYGLWDNNHFNSNCIVFLLCFSHFYYYIFPDIIWEYGRIHLVNRKLIKA